ncbi:L-rhamnose/proton symporter RhaT [Granulicella arctica]|uniref:L-rhamnose-H+ transport protein n=1 Tax=Granulicella arctica TaxID=940613 RepID=A0A7Y9PJG2_9BACT|nr:L-rhamnose/proton symporter RhaT [Granulicella arctica]NYF80971.1 L-rhamnose-H+ transport protein [Granulicella arctica]
MGTNPFIGVIYHWIGGFASATNFIPFRGIKRWSWEVYWLIQGFAAWIVAPLVLGTIFVPHLFSILRAAPSSSLGYAFLWGALWGIGGLTFGLAIRYLGIALGYAIALGLCTAFGTMLPPIFHGQLAAIAHETSGQIILAGVAVCLIAVAVNGAAGLSKEKEITPEEKLEAGEADFSFVKGIAVAIFAGIMSACFAFGLDAGAPIAHIAKAQLLASHRLDLWQNLPVLVVVLWGGFLTNFIWSAILIIKNRSLDQFTGASGINPMRATATRGDTLMDWDPRNIAVFERLTPRTLTFNYLFAALAGVIWYFQFFFYSMGQTKMGKYDFSSWALHMASIIIFATLWGLALREWRGTSRRTKLLVASGLFLLIASTIIIGYGNYIKATQEAAPIINTSSS